MKTVYSEEHVFHEAEQEYHEGGLHPPFEIARRAESVIEAVRQAGLGQDLPPEEVNLNPMRKIHDEQYLEFLESVHREWRREFGNKDAVPHTWSCRGLRQVIPKSILGRLGYYSYDADTRITAGTWHAAVTAAKVALTGQKLISRDGERAVFALTRPPGHHASRDAYGGYCFINNAAVAAQGFLDDGAERVAILDVDYHHGNGTQSIFYQRRDVLYLSLHADPSTEYPYFLGYSEEEGDGEGNGFNVNYPLPKGTEWEQYAPVLRDALRKIAKYDPQFIIVSLGVDTYVRDPIAGFGLNLEDFRKIGKELATARVPVLFVMEGGYALNDLGTAVTNVLQGFETT